MRARGSVVLAVSTVAALSVAAGPVRKLLTNDERAALLALINAVDVAQDTDVVTPVELPWSADVLKSTDIAYVPFRLGLASLPDGMKAAAMYVRVVSRHDGYRSTEQSSSLREWATRGGPQPPARMETVVFSPGELPIGGPAVSSSRRGLAAPAEASAVLAMHQKQYEQEKAAAEAQRRQQETERRDPYRFPFEEYYFFDARGAAVERAMAIPPGEYDVFVGLVDRSRPKTSTPLVIQHRVTVPDFWNLELQLSNLMLVSDVRTLSAPLKPQEQIEHPYTWGRAQVIPISTPAFGRNDVLSVVYQICNYGAPDTDVTAEYNFYWRIAGDWKLFNHTQPQQFDNRDLPLAVGWETQGFVMQRVPLEPFAPGEYKLDVVVKDRLTRQTASQSIFFTVK